ncbi:MAG: DUF3800 domain-containing protein [Firmicutes bacterium]|nr:DUF3800 domain-containing protein [Bacillota bacterium]
MIKTYIVLDESGAMHLKNERYFVIAGFITKELHKVTSKHKKIEAEIKEKKNIPLKQKVEFKSSKINSNQQAIFLNALYSISSVIPIAVIVDKDNLKKFKASENVAYNFFVKTLFNFLLNCNIDILDTKNIEFRLDNRNNSVKTLKDLETFLQWEFDMQNINIDVKYLDSKDNRDVQMADYVANLIWKKYNRLNESLSNKVANYEKIYLSKFPVKLFGINPSLRYLEKIEEKLKKRVANS